MKAEEILEAALAALRDRAASRDAEDGERSMALAVALFNEVVRAEGSPAGLSEDGGWLFMLCLKIARSTRGKPNIDDYVDMAGYAALLGECVTGGREDHE